MSGQVSIFTVKDMLGHSNTQMTVDIYEHLHPDRDKSAVNLLGNLCTDQKRKPRNQ